MALAIGIGREGCEVRKTTPVSEHMSRLPAEIDCRETVSTAMQRMREHAVRHLPVMDGPRISGLVSRQDLLDAWLKHGTGVGAWPVGDICTHDPLQVSPVTAIPDVARRMVERDMTSTLVVDEGMLVGIFTSVDALRLLASL